VTVHRLDGFVGDPSHVPSSIAGRILAQSYGRTEVDRIKGRMLARQLVHERKQKVTIALRQRFGLFTRQQDMGIKDSS
jgi:hypothetical protein